MAALESMAEMTANRTSDLRWLIALGFYIATALGGLTEALSQNALVHYLDALLLACSAAGWCVVDARRRDKKFPWAVQFLTLLFWIVAVPIYLIVSRGWSGLGWTFLNAIGFLATFVVANLVTYYVAFGPAAFAF